MDVFALLVKIEGTRQCDVCMYVVYVCGAHNGATVGFALPAVSSTI